MGFLSEIDLDVAGRCAHAALDACARCSEVARAEVACASCRAAPKRAAMAARRCSESPRMPASTHRTVAAWAAATPATPRSSPVAHATSARATSLHRAHASRSACAHRPATSRSISERNPMSHNLPVSLDDAAIEDFGRELDKIQREVKASLGDADRRYIRRMITIQRSLALGGRVLIYASLPLLPAFPLFLGVIGAGTAALGISKILENMEIGHNVIHGQWDWMADPEIHSSTWEWDNVCPADQWKHSHNVVHHTWTNVMGKDRDVGYEILRVSGKRPWKPAYHAQPFYNALLAMLFQWGVA